MGIRDKPIAPASPWHNGFAERLIGSIRRECLDHIIIRGEAHLRRVLKSYADYYCHAHVQAIIVAIDQYAEAALGNRDYFLNRPYGIGGKSDCIP